MAKDQTRQEKVELLQAQCEECIACLDDLVSIHLKTDPPSRIIEADDDQCFYRLRKARLHVQAIIGWQIEPDVLHVIAPEYRCANNQLEKVFRSMPESFRVNYLGEHDAVAGHFRQRAKELREIVSGFVHPTPQRLLVPLERGGFYESNRVPSIMIQVWMLVDLALNYEASVAYLFGESIAEVAPELTLVFPRIASVVATIGKLYFDEIVRAGE